MCHTPPQTLFGTHPSGVVISWVPWRPQCPLGLVGPLFSTSTCERHSRYHPPHVSPVALSLTRQWAIARHPPGTYALSWPGCMGRRLPTRSPYSLASSLMDTTQHLICEGVAQAIKDYIITPVTYDFFICVSIPMAFYGRYWYRYPPDVYTFLVPCPSPQVLAPLLTPFCIRSSPVRWHAMRSDSTAEYPESRLSFTTVSLRTRQIHSTISLSTQSCYIIIRYPWLLTEATFSHTTFSLSIHTTWLRICRLLEGPHSTFTRELSLQQQSHLLHHRSARATAYQLFTPPTYLSMQHFSHGKAVLWSICFCTLRVSRPLLWKLESVNYGLLGLERIKHLSQQQNYALVLCNRMTFSSLHRYIQLARKEESFLNMEIQ